MHCVNDVSHAAPDEVPEGVGAVTSYRRGLSPCVFVTWEGVATSMLNLPVKDMGRLAAWVMQAWWRGSGLCPSHLPVAAADSS